MTKGKEAERSLNIMYITPAFQHPKVRGPHRHYHFIRELSKRHSITLLTLIRSSVPKEAMKELEEYTKAIYTFNVESHTEIKLQFYGSSRLDSVLRLRNGVGQMKEKFNQLIREDEYDVILFHGKSVYPVIAGYEGIPIVVDFCDATSMRIRNKMDFVSKQRVPVLGLRYLQVRHVEKRMVKKTPYLAFITYRDREAILGSGDGSEIISNGIDLHYWTRKTRNPDPNTIIFTGVMNYAPNGDAALYLVDKVLPFLKQLVPDIKVLIVGRDPTPELVERGRIIGEVEVTGFVDDLRDYLEQAALFAAPVRFASGMQNKIQEALAMEVPVVTTSVVASGVVGNLVEDSPIIIAEGAQAFAFAVAELLNQPEKQKKLAKLGRIHAEKHYDWARSAHQLEKMCYLALEV